MKAKIRQSSNRIPVHNTLEEHLEFYCENPSCKKQREEEELKSIFEETKHYITWKCDKCNHKTWWESKVMSSGVDHINV